MTSTERHRKVYRLCLITGLLAALLLALGSRSAGAVRTRGGIVRQADLDWITFGHAASIGDGCIWAGIGLLIFSWMRLGRAVGNDTISLAHMWRIFAATTAPMLLAGPLFSRDVYSYLMQGTMLRD